MPITDLIALAVNLSSLLAEAVAGIERHNSGVQPTERDMQLAAAGRKSDVAEMIDAVKAAPEA